MPAAIDESEPKFSIFHPVITFEHREFYERIISSSMAFSRFVIRASAPRLRSVRMSLNKSRSPT